MKHSYTNLTSISAAIEKMNANIGEVASNIEDARTLVGKPTKTAAAETLMEQLETAAVEIAKAAKAFTRITAQTNLLAAEFARTEHAMET